MRKIFHILDDGTQLVSYEYKSMMANQPTPKRLHKKRIGLKRLFKGWRP